MSSAQGFGPFSTGALQASTQERAGVSSTAGVCAVGGRAWQRSSPASFLPQLGAESGQPQVLVASNRPAGVHVSVASHSFCRGAGAAAEPERSSAVPPTYRSPAVGPAALLTAHTPPAVHVWPVGQAGAPATSQRLEASNTHAQSQVPAVASTYLMRTLLTKLQGGNVEPGGERCCQRWRAGQVGGRSSMAGAACRQCAGGASPPDGAVAGLQEGHVGDVCRLDGLLEVSVGGGLRQPLVPGGERAEDGLHSSGAGARDGGVGRWKRAPDNTVQACNRMHSWMHARPRPAPEG